MIFNSDFCYFDLNNLMLSYVRIFKSRQFDAFGRY